MRLCIALLGFVLGATTSAAVAGEWQDHEAIRAAVAETVRAEMVPAEGRVDVLVDRPDHRLRLPACELPLDVSLPFGRRPTNRLTAEVRCAGVRPWKLHVAARLTVFRQVVVAARPLARGTILAPGDVKLAEQGGISLGYGYLPDPGHAVGHVLRRPVAVGKVLTPQMLASPKLIKRGQRVNLSAGSGPVQVRMSGIARSDGILGQVIDVENASSGRRVQAVVRSAKSAEVLLR